MIMMVMKHILAKWPDAFVGSQPHHELYPGYRLVLRFPIWAWVIWYASIIFTSMFLLEWWMNQRPCAAQLNSQYQNQCVEVQTLVHTWVESLSKIVSGFRFLPVSNVCLGTTSFLYQEVHQCWLHVSVAGQRPPSSSKEWDPTYCLELSW
jgi:hypothetical protein